jgi:predicted dehydrogenase
MKEIRAGLIGYKFMGRAHSNAFRQVNSFFDADRFIRPVALCGRNREAVSKAAEKFGFASYETDWKNLLKRDDIDFIDITTPGDSHAEMAIAAAEAGKHVFCEKPLANTSADAKRMLDTARNAGVVHQVGFNYRFVPAVRLAKRLIEEGKLGKIYHFRALYLQDWLVDPDFPLVWRLDKNKAGSGANGDINAHIIDLARYLTGDIVKVCGMQKTFIQERPLVGSMDGLKASGSGSGKGKVTVDDASLFLAEFKNGTVGSFEATRFANGRRNGMSFEINGSEGSVKFEFENMNELLYYNNNDPSYQRGFKRISVTEEEHDYCKYWWPAGHIIGYEHTFVHEMYEFAQAISKGKQACPDFTDGYECCRVLDAVAKSAEEGRWVEIGEIG